MKIGADYVARDAVLRLYDRRMFAARLSTAVSPERSACRFWLCAGGALVAVVAPTSGMPPLRWGLRPCQAWQRCPAGARCTQAGRVLSALQGAGEAEVGQDAGVEAGHGADLAAGEGDDDQPGRVPDASLWVLDVHAEGGLPVGPGRYEAGPPVWPERGGGQVPGGQVAALVNQWVRWQCSRSSR